MTRFTSDLSANQPFVTASTFEQKMANAANTDEKKATVEDPKTGNATSEDDDEEEIISHDYLVHVFTGDKQEAGTHADVLITIFGEESDSRERILNNDKNNFEMGKKDSFTVRCGLYLGRLTKIRIGHDNTGFGAGWFLDKVIVEDLKTRDSVEFPCERWFSTSKDDGQITRELTRADSKDKGHDYLVYVFTGDQKGAGTDAKVMMKIIGEGGDSGVRRLVSDKNNFQKGTKDSFTLSCATSLGRLTKITIGDDNTGFHKEWFLDKVTQRIEDPKIGETVEFPCQKWFCSGDKDGGQIRRELARADVKGLKILHYFFN